MGTSRSSGQLVAKLDRFAQNLSDTKPGLTAAAIAGKATFQAQAAASGVLGSKLVGKRKMIGARYDLRGSGYSGSAIVSYTGPAHLVNNPTSPHYIAAKGLGPSRRRKGVNRMRNRQDAAFSASAAGVLGGSTRGVFGGSGKGAKALTIGPNLRAYAFHPGTRGKGFAQRARFITAKQSPAIYTRAGITAPMKGVFR